MEIPIEKNVPIPLAKNEGNKWLELVGKMEIGDSVLVPSVNGTPNSIALNRVRAAMRYASAKLNRKLIFRTVEGGVRVWRLE